MPEKSPTAQSRKLLCVSAYRGFESHPLRTHRAESRIGRGDSALSKAVAAVGRTVANGRRRSLSEGGKFPRRSPGGVA